MGSIFPASNLFIKKHKSLNSLISIKQKHNISTSKKGKTHLHGCNGQLIALIKNQRNFSFHGELRILSLRINSHDILTNSPHYFYTKYMGQERRTWILRVYFFNTLPFKLQHTLI